MKLELPQLLNDEKILKRYKSINNWKLIEMHHLRGIFKFKDFKDALDFVFKVGNMAEEMQHHPEINLSWGRVEIIIFTHDRGGLTRCDFEFASNVNKIMNKNK